MRNIVKFIIIGLLIVLSVPFGNYIGNKGNIVRLNNSITIDNIALLTPIEESKAIDNRDYRELNGFGGRSFEKKDGSITVVYSGYPDVKDDYHLTRIIVKSGAYEVYGVTIGTSVEEMNLKMGTQGYEKKVVGSRYIYKKNKIIIVFQKNYKDEISAFEIMIETTNKDDVIF